MTPEPLQRNSKNLLIAMLFLCPTACRAPQPPPTPVEKPKLPVSEPKPQYPRVRYRLIELEGGLTELRQRFTPEQLALLEKLNRADLRHLALFKRIIVPDRWDLDELAYNPLPHHYPWAEQFPKLLVVHQPGQVFGAYEYGRLVRWGPVNSGRREEPTPQGLFHLNWKSRGRTSTINPEWYMEWYFNFHNTRGLSIHAYSLPGYPASHGCIRMLERDARWVYYWADQWVLDERSQKVIKPGTPLLILGCPDFDSRPWLSPAWWEKPIDLPPDPIQWLEKQSDKTCSIAAASSRARPSDETTPSQANPASRISPLTRYRSRASKTDRTGRSQHSIACLRR